MADKSIKISIIVDQQSAIAAKRLIGEVNKEVEELIKTAGRASQALGGVGGVRASNSNINIPGLGGTQGASARNTVGQGIGGIFGSIAGGISGIKSAIFGSKAIFKDISDGLKTFSDQSTSSKPSIDALTTSLKKLNTQLHALKGAGVTIPGMPGGTTASAAPAIAAPPAPATPTSPRAGGGGFISNIASNLQGMGGIPALGGTVLKAMGPIGLAAGAAIGGYSFLNDARITSKVANIQQELERPFWRSEQQATAGRVFGGMYFGIRGGDMATSMAISKVKQNAEDPAIRYFTDQKFREKQIELARIAAGDWRVTGRLGDMGAAAKNQIGMALNTTQGVGARPLIGLGGIPIGTVPPAPAIQEINKSAIELKMAKSEQDLKIKNMEQFEAQVNRTQQNFQFQRDSRAMQSIWSNAQHRVAVSRTGGFGGGWVKDKTLPPWGKGEIRDAYNLMEEKMIEQGYSMEELMGSQRSVGTSVSWRMRGLGRRAMGMQAGGFGAFSEVARLGATTGGLAGAQGMLGAVQGSIGRGGIDITAGTQLFGGLARAAGSSGQFGIDYSQLFSGMGGAAFTGEGGKDVRMSDLIQRGMGVLDKTYSGSRDPLQQFINQRAALDVAGTKGMGAVMALQDVKTVDRLAMLRSGKVSENLQNWNLSLEDVRGYQSKVNQEGLIRSIGLGGKVGEVADKIRTDFAGNYLDYAKDQAKGLDLKTTKGREALRQRLLPVAQAIASGTGEDEGDTLGGIYAELSAEKGVFKGLKAGGAGFKPTGDNALVLRKQAELKREIALDEEKLRSNISPMARAPIEEHLEELKKNLRDTSTVATAAGEVDLGKLSAVMEEFVGVIQATTNSLKTGKPFSYTGSTRASAPGK